MTNPARISRLTLVGLALIFAVPIILSWFMQRDGWRPTGTTNNGTLLSPIRPVSVAGLETRDGKPLPPGFFQRKWTVVLIGPSPCGESCREALYTIRQSRLALGKDTNRVQRVYVTPIEATGTNDDAKALLEAHAGLHLGRAVPAWLAAFSVQGSSPNEGYRIFLIDPQSFVIMHYNSDVDGSFCSKTSSDCFGCRTSAETK